MSAQTVELRRNLGMSRRWLRHDLARLDPATDPVAYALDPERPVGRALAAALDQNEQWPHMGWAPRATLLRALRETSPLDAVTLERAAATDVGRWTVLYADATVRVALETFHDLAALVEAPPQVDCVVGLARCIDRGEHVWDAEFVLEDEADDAEEGGETACSKCGVGFESWMLNHMD